MTESILFIALISIGGAVITWLHGKRKYKEGMIFALIDLHKGNLTYTYEEIDGNIYMEVTHEVEDA
jgi:hypothetical protein